MRAVLNTNDPYLAYYRRQQYGGAVPVVFRGSSWQRGHGIGSFLSGLFRTAVPLLKSGASAVGKEALRSGLGMLKDIGSGTVQPRDSLNTRLKQFTGGLKRRADDKVERVLQGGGYKRRRISRVTPHSLDILLRAPAKRRATKRSSKKQTSNKRTTKKRNTKKRTTKKRTTKRKLQDIFD